MRVVYLVVCGAPPAAQVPQAVAALRGDGWVVCVVATPSAVAFLDVEAVEALTAPYPVRSHPRDPDQPDPFPPADAVVVAPLTFNTVNKWAAGVSDTLALGLLNELLCSGLPVVAGVWAKEALRRHPAYPRSVETLRGAGVVFVGEGSGADGFPWDQVRAALPA